MGELMESEDKKRILIVDDDAFTRKHIRKIVETAGYHVVGEFSDGRQVKDLIDSFKPDLVLMDLVMKDISGIHAANIVVKRSPNVKVLMVSSVTQDEIIEGCLQAGACGFLGKPFTDEQLVNKIKEALG